jgi:hypothetical protein
VTARCTVDAPDAFAAFVLARRIDPLADEAAVETAPSGFCVSVQADTDELARVLRVVQAWMDEERIGETTVRYAGRTQLLRAA